MGMSISTAGLTELNQLLGKLGARAQDVASGALFDGAGIVADAFTSAVSGIETAPFKYARPGKTRLPSPEEKAALEGKTGIAKFRKDGSEVNTLVGFNPNSGYADVAGHTKPVPVIARSINSGTSFMKKQPVFRKAVSKSREPAQQAIVAKAEQMLEEIINS